MDAGEAVHTEYASLADNRGHRDDGNQGMILSVDLGTSKLCAVAVDMPTACLLALRSCPNDTDIPHLLPDMHEQDPIRTRDLCFGLIKDILTDNAVVGRPVDAIGISGQMHGVLLVDSDLRPLTNLITWRDRRTAQEGGGSITESLRLLGPEVESRCGCRLATGYGAATLRWLDQNDLLPKNCMALTIAGFIAASLTGICSIDETHAASWGILDVHRKQWDEDCTARLGIRGGILPEIRPSGAPLSEVGDDLGESLGIVGRRVVCSPVGDCQASVIGCAGFSNDTIVLNLGTGGQISIPSADGLCTEELDAWPLPFGGYLQLGAALCGGWSYAYLKQFFQRTVREIAGIELTDEQIYERMNSLAVSAEPGSSGLIFDTRFSGTRKDKSVRGSISAIDTSNLTPANLSSAVLEGVVRDLRSMWLTSQSRTARRLVAAGNAVRRNAVLRSVIKRQFDLDCYTSNLPEEAARGASYAAAVGVELASREGITSAAEKAAEPFADI